MKRRSAILTFLGPVLVAAASLAFPTSDEPNADKLEDAKIRATVQDYLGGAADGDVGRLRKAFHKSARLQSVREGKYAEISLEQFFGFFQEGKKTEIDGRILSVDIAGTCAVVKLEADWGQSFYTDFLCLLQVEGEWKIVNKSFLREPPRKK